LGTNPANAEAGTGRYLVWLEQSQHDLDAAMLSLKNGFYEWTAYQAEQSVEKALKSVLVNAGWRPPKMHKLGVLFGLCNNANMQFKYAKFSFHRLESFTFISRYPFLLPGKDKAPHDLISYEKAQDALKEAAAVVAKISEILKKKSDTTPQQFVETVYDPQKIQTRLENVKQILIKEFTPEKIILFGRYAREQGKPLTGTIDMLIIANTELPFIDRIMKARNATGGVEPIIEPLVYTPEEFKVLTEDEKEGFLQNALEEGKVIYTK
jgi:HEPN domain-containing protein